MRSTMTREAKAAYGEIKKGLDHLGRSVTQAERHLARAERQIEADAKARIRQLRRDGKAQLALLRARRRDANRMLGHLSAAAGDSWREVKKAADRTLSDGRSLAKVMIKRFSQALRA